MLTRRLLLACLATIPAGTALAQESGPASPVLALNEGLQAVRKAGRATPFAQRAAMLTPVIERVFALETVLQASVGPRYAALTPEQRAALLATFTEYTVDSYVANFDIDSGERFTVSPDIRALAADRVVTSMIVPRNGTETRLDYQVRQDADGWKIVDVLIDGAISQVAVQRSDFRHLLSSGSASGLIDSLRRKTASLASGGKL